MVYVMDDTKFDIPNSKFVTVAQTVSSYS